MEVRFIFLLLPLVACSDLPAPVPPPSGEALLEFTCAIRSDESPLILVNLRDRRGLIRREWSAVVQASTFRRIERSKPDRLQRDSGTSGETDLDFWLEITTDWHAKLTTPRYGETELQTAREHLARFDNQEIRAELDTRDRDGPIRQFHKNGEAERYALSHALIERGFYVYYNTLPGTEIFWTIFATDSLCEYVEAMTQIREKLKGVDLHFP